MRPDAWGVAPREMAEGFHRVAPGMPWHATCTRQSPRRGGSTEEPQMKSVVMSAILFTACATTGTPTLDRETHAGSRVQLDLVPHADATRVFPAAIDPRLP